MIAMPHPRQATLSRLVDVSEIEWMRSRAGRHTLRCPRCTAEVAALRALGEEARGLAPAALPPELQGRISTQRREGGRASVTHATAVEGVEENAGPAVRRPGFSMQRGAVVGVAAAVVLVALVWPAWRGRTLAAAGPGAVTIFPQYPRAGAAIGIRFVPKTGWTGPDTLWAESAIDLRPGADGGHRLTEAYLSVPLVRGRDGTYRGRTVLPDDALSGSVIVWRLPRGQQGGPGVGEFVLLTSDSSPTRPSLDAMESAVYHDRSFMVDKVLVDAFARWAPDHPMRWLLSSNQRQDGTFDWLRFFESGERRFAALTKRLDATPNARAGELAGMASLAYRLEEPEAGAAWTDRLVREHPDDPHALDLRVQQIHEMELRGAPRDSIVALIPSLDTLYERAGGQLVVPYALGSVVRNNADSATIRRWELREGRSGRYYGSEFGNGREAFRDPELRDSISAYAREVLARPEVRDGRVAQVERSRAWSYLARAALARGDYRSAIALTDSSRVSPCLWVGQDTRAVALIASGDTASALPYMAAWGNNGMWLTPDSAQRMLGSHFSPSRWRQALDSVEAARQSCRHQAR